MNGAAVAIEQSRCGDDELKLEIRVGFDGSERRPDPRVAGAGGDDDADFPLGH
jgi:hypothetical protein